uniref:Uncharacterized protein n=1 Tax=Tanacetum cinerariifolium TaxID=118510 RepID=A0A6L2NH18_TANCI|nr:hypothetical protein [Tanacetum cinerariifolium]
MASTHPTDGTTVKNGHGPHDTPPGKPMTLGTHMLDKGAQMLRSLKPIKQMSQHVCTFALYSQDKSRQIETHHFVTRINQDFLQCAVYDSDDASGRLIGVEYIVSDKIFDTLSPDEQKLWHSHAHEWVRCNAIVLDWILGSLSQELYFGQVYSEVAYVVWDELEETYDRIDGEFNILTLLLACTYVAHKSNLLARDPLHDVKDAFAIVSREESYRGLPPGKLSAKSPVAFVVRTNNGIQICSSCEKNSGSNVDVSQNASTSASTMSASFTNEQMMKLLSLINEKPAANVSGNMSAYDYFKKDMFNVVDISSLRLTIGHPNGTMAKLLLFNCKLGHPSDQLLFVLSDKVCFKSSNHVSACDICHKAKQTKDPFPLSDHKSSKLGDLVHLDVWDPYKVTSKDEYTYFLIVVDDFSRVVWVK